MEKLSTSLDPPIDRPIWNTCTVEILHPDHRSNEKWKVHIFNEKRKIAAENLRCEKWWLFSYIDRMFKKKDFDHIFSPI